MAAFFWKVGRRKIDRDAFCGHGESEALSAARTLSLNALIEAPASEAAITIDRKYASAWTGRLQTKFLVISNLLPKLADASGALASRFIILKLIKSFYGREDLALTDKLLKELPGILNWSIDGWHRLMEFGHFKQPKSALDEVQEFEDLASPISAFLRERCEIGQS
jgi:putative DNA primase/helicase